MTQVSPTRVRLKVRYSQDRHGQILTITIGKWLSIGGINSYVATPPGEYPKNKAILFLTDGFGPQLLNNQVRFFFTKLMIQQELSISCLRTTLLPMVSRLVPTVTTLRLPSTNFHLSSDHYPGLLLR